MQKLNITPEEQGKTSAEAETPAGYVNPSTGRIIPSQIRQPTQQPIQPIPTSPQEESEE